MPESRALLVVDDGKESRRMIKNFAGESAEDFHILDAANGEEALQQHDCDGLQGFYFFGPLPGGKIPAYLAS